MLRISVLLPYRGQCDVIHAQKSSEPCYNLCVMTRLKPTKAQIIYDYCKKQGWDSFMWGDGSLIDEMFDVAELKAEKINGSVYPVSKWKAVLDVCEKNAKSKRPLFKKFHVDLRGMYGIPHQGVAVT